MRVVSAAEIDDALSFATLIEALERAFRGDVVVPHRHHHEIARPGSPATLLLMPAWTGAASEAHVGVKVVSVFPENAARSLPSVFGTYLLMDGATGEPLAALDGTRLTRVAHGCRFRSRRAKPCARGCELAWSWSAPARSRRS